MATCNWRNLTQLSYGRDGEFSYLVRDHESRSFYRKSFKMYSLFILHTVINIGEVSMYNEIPV